MRILGEGNVGIGTAAPVNLLQISTAAGQTDTYGNVQINYTGTVVAANSGLTVKNYNGTSQFMQWEAYGLRIGSRLLTNSGVGDIVFTAGADSEKMRIKATGKVGIGTAAPATTLHVVGDATITDDLKLLSDSAILSFGADSEVTLTHIHNVGLAQAAGQTIYRTAAGQYDAGFCVRENIANRAAFEWGHTNTGGYGSTLGNGNGNGAPYIAFHAGPGTNANTFETHGLKGRGMYSNNSNALIFFDVATAAADNQAATTRMTLNTDSGNLLITGSVGIGTTAPATTLDVTTGTIRTGALQGGYGNGAGNFHIDAKAGLATGAAYLNWFAGQGGVVVGNGSSGYGPAYASAFNVSSDRRLKENISYFDSGLAQILQLKPATFDFINGENNQKGFIAQDVETVIPEVVATTTMPDSAGNVDETDEYLTLNSPAIIPYLVAAIKEQQAMILALTDRIATLEA
jgi:hypothetical protein